MFPTRNVTIWYMATCGMSFLTKVVHSWLSEVRSVKLLSWDQSQDTSDMPFSLKILTVMIRAHDGRAECSLNWNRLYTKLALIVNFKWIACKKWTWSTLTIPSRQGRCPTYNLLRDVVNIAWSLRRSISRCRLPNLPPNFCPPKIRRKKSTHQICRQILLTDRISAEK